VQKTRNWLRDSEADALLVSNDYNRRYLSGFTGTSGWLLISANEALLITDSRYTEQAGKQAPEFAIVPQTGSFAPLLLDLCKQNGFGRLAIESDHVSVATYESYQEKLQGEVKLVSTQGVVEDLRMSKEPDEVAALQHAITIADNALAELLKWLRPGVTERETAWRLEVLMREGGAEGLSFPSIVAAGPNGAMPHHRPGDDVIPGDTFIVMDFGCIADGYCSDMTRTVAIGTPSPEMQAIYRIVYAAQKQAAAQVRAGMTGVEADALAREIIAAAGHGDHFGHGLGHGVGLEIHEAPRLSPLAGDTPLPAGAVVSIEPGIYLPGVGGVRIEDLVLLHEDGADNLTGSPKLVY
jgi:Xaa-Pro aminopeptidase